MKDNNTLPDFWCEHQNNPHEPSLERVFCENCGSFFDLKALKSNFEYDGSYPAERFHFDPVIGQNKYQTLELWQKKLNLDFKGKVVCELGFGAGHSLKFFKDQGANVYGVEIVKENIIFASEELKIEASHLFHTSEIPDQLPEKIDLWVYLDSFEHIEEPNPHLEWVLKNSKPGSEIFLVCPRGDSLTAKIFWPFWFHRLPDHKFHWSKKGLESYFGSRGFETIETFFPTKVLSLSTACSHFVRFLGIKKVPEFLGKARGIKIFLNFGEIGIRFILKR